MPYVLIFAVMLFIVYRLGAFFVALFIVSAVVFSVWPRHKRTPPMIQNTAPTPHTTPHTDPAPQFVVTWDTLDPRNINRAQRHAKSYDDHGAALREQRRHHGARIRTRTP